MSFLEDLSSKTVLRRAWESVAAKRGVAGIDRVSIDDFAADLASHLQQLRRELRDSSYRPLPAMRIRPPFLRSSDRALVVPTVRDRVVHRAIADLLTPAVEPTLAASCRAFRKGFSAIGAADDVGRWVETGTPWVLRADVARFFDSICRETLHGKLEPFVDAEGLAFLDRLLRTRIFDHHQVSEMVVGIAQGSPLSPLLGNLYLSEVDHALLAEHPQSLRYCDDILVLGEGEEQVRGAGERLAALLEPLSLTLNQEKTRVCRAEDGFVFLGYHFGPAGRGPAVKAVEALRCRLAELAAAEVPDPGAVDAVYRGWTAYFGEHPEIWSESPAGILALLRAGASAEELIAARWRQPFEASPSLALALAEAWRAARRPDQSWLEMAMACGGSRCRPALLERWAAVLASPAQQVEALARRLTGPPADRLTVLTEAVAELTAYDTAGRLAALGDLFAAAPEAAPETGTGTLTDDADLRLLERWFQGREGVHAEETVRRSGHRCFMPLHRPIGEDDWRAHLAGEKTLALPLVRAGNTALLGVLDIDVSKRALHRQLDAASELLGRALATAMRLRREIARRGGEALLELSGAKGYHLWLRLAEPVPCYLLRRWLLDLVRAVSPLPEGIRVEEFPNRDRVRTEAVGPLVKLPLGVHSKTGRRCALLDERGEPLADPFAALRELTWLPADLLSQQRPAGSDAPKTPEATAIGPRARRLLEGCRVLGYLAKRAEQTSYLNHRERLTLLCCLGHLGDEGRAALHTIIGHTYNYRREVTDRHTDRMPEYPISCPKVRELHPEAGVEGSCACQFDLRGRGYPTPVLHALRPAEVPVWRQRKASRKPPSREGAAGKSPPRQGNAGPGGGQPGGDRPEALVRKLAELKRHRRGLDGSIERLSRELAELFDERGADHLQLSIGTLRRVRPEPTAGWVFSIEV